MDKCQIKGCENPSVFVFLSHVTGDKDLCQECRKEYFPRFTITFRNISIKPTVKEEIDYLVFRLRQHVAVATEAKALGYGDDLLSHSIKSSEKLIAEVEELITQHSNMKGNNHEND